MRLRPDVIGRIPQIGSRIAYNPPYYKGLKVAIVIGFAKSGLPIIVPQDEYEEYLEDSHGYNDTPKTGFVILDK